MTCGLFLSLRQTTYRTRDHSRKQRRMRLPLLPDLHGIAADQTAMPIFMGQALLPIYVMKAAKCDINFRICKKYLRLAPSDSVTHK